MGLTDVAVAIRAERVLADRFSNRADRDGSTVRMSSEDGSRVLIEVLRSLDAEDLAPATLTVREPSMDDVFLALTGRRAQGPADEPAPDGARAEEGAA
jgi:hypothetical protein